MIRRDIVQSARPADPTCLRLADPNWGLHGDPGWGGWGRALPRTVQD